jgi:hypothetical protein
MTMANSKTLDGLKLFQSGKPVDGSPQPGETYAVRPVAGGSYVKATGRDVVQDLAGEFPKSHFLWLSAPVKVDRKKADKPTGKDDAPPPGDDAPPPAG